MRTKLFLFILSCYFFVALPIKAQAMEGNVDFGIRGIIPDNQIDKTQTYFDLLLAPSQEQTIQVEIANDAGKEEQFQLNIHQAYTNGSGLIDYVDGSIEKDPSLNYAIEELVEAPTQVSVPGNTTLPVELKVRMPQQSFDGRIMAGIQVLKMADASDGQKVASQYGYILGLQLRNNLNEVPRELKASNASAAVSYGKTSFKVMIQNPTTDAIGKLTFKGQVQSKDSGQVIKEVTVTDRTMAPTSNFNLVFGMEDAEITPGDYQLLLTATDGKGNQWHFDEAFTVSEKEAQEINGVIIPEQQDQALPPWVFALIGAVAALALLVGGMFVKMQRARKQMA